MNLSVLIKSKTFWVGVLTVAAGVVEAAFDGWSSGSEKVLLGLAMIFGRIAIEKNGPTN